MRDNRVASTPLVERKENEEEEEDEQAVEEENEQVNEEVDEENIRVLLDSTNCESMLQLPKRNDILDVAYAHETAEELGIPKETYTLFRNTNSEDHMLEAPISQQTVHFLSSAYQSRRQDRHSYTDLFSFFVFFMLYLIALSMQSRSLERFEIVDAIREDLIPKDETGGPENIFERTDDVYNWISDTVSNLWTDPVCGDGICEHPFETSSFQKFGCLSDCGKKNMTVVHLVLEENLQDHTLTGTTTYNLCHKTETLNKYQDYAPVCIWDVDQTFDPKLRVVSYELALPDGEWEVRLGNVGGSGAIVFGGVSVGDVAADVAVNINFNTTVNMNVSRENMTDLESVGSRKILSFIGTPSTPEQERRVRRRLLQSPHVNASEGKLARESPWILQKESLIDSPSKLSLKRPKGSLVEPHMERPMKMSAGAPWKSSLNRPSRLLRLDPDSDFTSPEDKSADSNTDTIKRRRYRSFQGSRSVEALLESPESQAGAYLSDWDEWERNITDSLTAYPVKIGTFNECFDAARELVYSLPDYCILETTPSSACCQYYVGFLEGNCLCSSSSMVIDGFVTFFNGLIPSMKTCQRYLETNGTLVNVLHGAECPIDSPNRHQDLPNEIACAHQTVFFRDNIETLKGFCGLNSIHSNQAPAVSDECCLSIATFHENECQCSDAAISVFTEQQMTVMQTIYGICGKAHQWNMQTSALNSCEAVNGSRPFINMTVEQAMQVKLFRNKDAYRVLETQRNALYFSSSENSTNVEYEYLSFCGVNDHPPLDCEAHFNRYFNELMMDFDGAAGYCSFKYQIHICDRTVINACGSTFIEAVRLRYESAMESIEIGIKESCIPENQSLEELDCAVPDAVVSENAPIIREHIKKCAPEVEQCYFYLNETASRIVLEEFFASVSPWTLYVDYMDHFVNGSLDTLECKDSISLIRRSNAHFNVLCRDPQFQSPENSFQTPYVLSPCEIHADCGSEHFCALLKSVWDTNATCMPCWHCCSYEGDNFMSSLQMLGSEPGCGHCDCDTPCSGGCDVEMRTNGECQEECMSEECSWSFGNCGRELQDDEISCPADVPGVFYGDVVLETNRGVCCSVGELRSESFSFGVYAFSNRGDPNPLELNETVLDDNQVFDRRIANSNVILGGMLLHAVRYELRERCEYTDRFHHLYSSCRGSPSTHPYGVDPVFQSGTSLFDADTVANLPSFYNSDEDLNQFGVPYGFRFGEMEGFPDGFPILFDINLDASRASDWVAYLMEGGFLRDMKTLTIQMVTFNPDNGIFGNVKVIFRFNRSGAIRIFNFVQVQATEMYTKDRILNVVMDILFVMFWLMNVLAEVYECLHIGIRTYLRKLSNLLDFLSLAMGGAVICMWCFISFIVAPEFDIKARYNVYEDMFSDGNWLKLANDGAGLRKMAEDFYKMDEYDDYFQVYFLVNCMNIILMIFRLLRLMDFHPDIGMITRTLREAWSDLVNFTVLALCIVVVFSFMALITLGVEFREFRTLQESIQTCLLFMVGEFGNLGDLDKMENLGYSTKVAINIMFWTYMLLMYLILLSALIAIIVSSMDRIKDPNRKSTHIVHEIADMSYYAWKKLLSFFPGNRVEEMSVAKLMKELNKKLENPSKNEENVDVSTIEHDPQDLWSLFESDEHKYLCIGYHAMNKNKIQEVISEACKLASKSEPHSTVSVENSSRLPQVADSILNQFGETKSQVAEKIRNLMVERNKQKKVLKQVSDEKWRENLNLEVSSLNSRLDNMESTLGNIESTLVKHLKAMEDKIDALANDKKYNSDSLGNGSPKSSDESKVVVKRQVEDESDTLSGTNATCESNLSDRAEWDKTIGSCRKA